MTPNPANLQRLVERFKAEATEWRSREDYHFEHAQDNVADECGREAETLERCARELERVLAGETPPETGQEWREEEK